MVQYIIYGLMLLSGAFAMPPNEGFEREIEDIESSIDREVVTVKGEEKNEIEATTDAEVEVTKTSKTPDAAVSNSVYEVQNVIDGDTLSITKEGRTETIRMIGVDTPETVHPSKPVQCFGKEASAKTKSWLNGQKVKVEFDNTQGERDKYGRLLGYVYRNDGLFVNLELIKQGYAYEYTYNLPYKYQAEFQEAEREAEATGSGLWNETACAEVIVETKPAPAPAFVPAVETAGGAQCSSDAYNCGDFSTHAEAQAVFTQCGGTDKDIHRLDSDGDGLACESLR